MDGFELIADRRIRAAQAEGFFDNLPGAGKPIRDLHRQRPPGWWPARLVKEERSRLKAEQLDREMRAAMPALWRSGSEAQVLAQVGELNQQIRDYNGVTSLECRPRLDPAETVERWHRYRREHRPR